MDEQKKKKELLKRKRERKKEERAMLRIQEERSFSESMEIIASKGSIKGIKL